MTSSNITCLNLDKENLHWCTLGAAVSRQLITTCVCANLSNKCSSQSCVLFRVQQHITYVYKYLLTVPLQVQTVNVNSKLFQSESVFTTTLCWRARFVGEHRDRAVARVGREGRPPRAQLREGRKNRK